MFIAGSFKRGKHFEQLEKSYKFIYKNVYKARMLDRPLYMRILF